MADEGVIEATLIRLLQDRGPMPATALVSACRGELGEAGSPAEIRRALRRLLSDGVLRVSSDDKVAISGGP